MGANSSVNINKIIIFFEFYPYFFNNKGNELTYNLANLIVENKDKFKLFLIELIKNALYKVDIEIRMVDENIFLEIYNDGDEYLHVEIICKMLNLLELNNLIFDKIKFSIINEIHFSNSLEIMNNVFLQLRENDLRNIFIS